MDIARFGKMARAHRYVAVVAVLTVGSLLAGCSTDRLFGGSSAGPAPAPGGPAPASSGAASNSPGGGGLLVANDISDFFMGSTGVEAPVGGGTDNVECPGIDVRQGASTLTVPPGGGGSSVLALRYQGTIGQMARQCRVTGGTMRMKVGVQGRIILGPAGGPGKLDVPLRYAVVHEGPEPKTIMTKFYKVPVTIANGQTNVAFTHIDEDIAFPVPKGDDLESYVVYVGFDAVGEKQQPARKPAPKPALKPARAR
jgi:hypothetical protein